jgi:uncharacterized protein
MDVRRFEDPAAWLRAAEPILGADEPRHNLLYGVTDTLIRRPEAYAAFHLWLAEEGGEPAGAMLQTPPWNVVVAAPRSDEALDALVAAAVRDTSVPGVTAAVPEATAFAERWASATGGAWRVRMEEGIYACETVHEVAPADGASRIARPEDLDALLPMIAAFVDEALPPDGVHDLDAHAASTRSRLAEDPRIGGFWVREVDGAIVSLTGHGGRTPTGMRIGPVYTPPDHRGHGYATNLVAEQTTWLLANAVDRCFLFTDLANATSNGVYRRIGYVQTAEAVDVAFEAAR